jgi:hypothetical protein
VVLRARIDIVLSILSGVAAIVTAVWPTWIEGLLGFDPDGGNGSAEWWTVATLAVIALGTAALARRDLRGVRRRTPSAHRSRGTSVAR